MTDIGKVPPMNAATIARVAVASPGDLPNERNAVRSTIHEWNQKFSDTKGIVYLTYMWEHDVAATAGRGGPQDVINNAIIFRSHVLIALFGSRIGSATDNAISGTVEEIERAVSMGIPVHILFSTKALSRRFDRSQLAKLDDYRESLWQKRAALTADFANLTQLKQEVTKCLDADIAELTDAFERLIIVRPGILMSIRARRLVNGDLEFVISNKSSSIINGVRLQSIKSAAAAGGRVPGIGNRIDLAPDGEVRYPLPFKLQNGLTLEATVTWVSGNHVSSVTENVPVP